MKFANVCFVFYKPALSPSLLRFHRLPDKILFSIKLLQWTLTFYLLIQLYTNYIAPPSPSSSSSWLQNSRPLDHMLNRMTVTWHCRPAKLFATLRCCRMRLAHQQPFQVGHWYFGSSQKVQSLSDCLRILWDVSGPLMRTLRPHSRLQFKLFATVGCSLNKEPNKCPPIKMHNSASLHGKNDEKLRLLWIAFECWHSGTPCHWLKSFSSSSSSSWLLKAELYKSSTSTHAFFCPRKPHKSLWRSLNYHWSLHHRPWICLPHQQIGRKLLKRHPSRQLTWGWKLQN